MKSSLAFEGSLVYAATARIRGDRSGNSVPARAPRPNHETLPKHERDRIRLEPRSRGVPKTEKVTRHPSQLTLLTGFADLSCARITPSGASSQLSYGLSVNVS